MKLSRKNKIPMNNPIQIDKGFYKFHFGIHITYLFKYYNDSYYANNQKANDWEVQNSLGAIFFNTLIYKKKFSLSFLNATGKLYRISFLKGYSRKLWERIKPGDRVKSIFKYLGKGVKFEVIDWLLYSLIR